MSKKNANFLCVLVKLTNITTYNKNSDKNIYIYTLFLNAYYNAYRIKFN